MMGRWGISPREFTTFVAEHTTDHQILLWLSERVTPDRVREANEWLLRQHDALDRHDAEEGVPGAVAPTLLRREIMLGLAVAAITLLATWISRELQH